jgi:hypothetical protein
LYADDGRPGLPPGRYFRLLLIGYFEGLDAERAIAWRAADSRALQRIPRHWPSRRLPSGREAVLIAQYDLTHNGARKMAFTTGC